MAEDKTGHRMEDAVESTAAKMVTRFGVPLLLTSIAVLGSMAFGDIKNDLAEGSADRATATRDIGQIKSDVRDLNTRLDAQVIRQVEQNTKQIERLDQRTQTLERTVRTP